MALGSFTLVTISGRAAGRGIDTIHLIFYRSVVGLVLITTLVMFSRAGLRQLATRRLGHHALRNTIHFVAQYSWLSALLLIPLTQLIAIEFTAPLWVAILAPLERRALSWKQFCLQTASRASRRSVQPVAPATGKRFDELGGRRLQTRLGGAKLCLARAGRICPDLCASRLVRSTATHCDGPLDLEPNPPRQNGSNLRLDALVLRERLTLTRIIAAIVGFAGILVIVRPGSVPVSEGTIFAMVAAFGFAGSMITTKQLVRTETILCFLFHMSWMQLVVVGLPIIQNLQVPTPETAKWIVAMALSAMMAHFSLARAFTYADAIIVAPMDFMRLPLLMVVGVLLYAERIDPIVLAGAALVIAANLINIFWERRS